MFYEGPPTANGRPGSHHVLSRVFKDVFPRYRTMRGRLVHRKGGWDYPRPAGRAGDREEAGLQDQGRHRALRRGRVQRQVPRVGAQLHRRVEPADRADRLLDRHRRRLLHARRRLHRVGLVVAQAGVGQGPALRGLQGRALLPALRHRAVLARGRRWATRTWSTRRCSCASRSTARTASRSWPGPRCPGRCCSNAALAVDPDIPYVRVQPGRRAADRGRGAGRAGVRRGRRRSRTGCPAPSSWAWPTSRRSRT